jgi:long-chain fatty acid transport protein
MGRAVFRGRSRRAALVLCFCGASSFLGGSRSEANPYDMFGAGARASSMGGAHTAAANDSSANYYNPALLARLPSLEIDIGYRMALPDLQLNERSLDVDAARGTRISLGMPGKVGIVPLGVGVSVYLPDQHLTRNRSLSQTQPRFSLYDNRAQRLFLSVNGGFAIGEKLSVGGGLAYVTSTEGSVKLSGRVGFPDAEDSDLLLAMDVDVRTLVYPVAGVAYQLKPWLRVAASYRGGAQPISDLRVDIEGDIGAANLEPIVADAAVNLRSIALSHYQPAELSIGLDANLNSDLRIALDLAFHRWSTYRNPAAKLETELELGEFNEFIDPTPPALLAPATFHDIIIPRVGLEYRLYHTEYSLLQGRAGYSFEPSPAPEQVGVTNFVDNDKHTAAMGMGLTFRPWPTVLLQPMSLDASFALTSLRARAHRKISAVDAVGDYVADGSIWQFSMTTRIRF